MTNNSKHYKTTEDIRANNLSLYFDEDPEKVKNINRRQDTDLTHELKYVLKV